MRLVLVIALCLICVGFPLLYYLGRPLPMAMRTKPFQGVTYYRRVHFNPYPMVAHIVIVDLQAKGIEFLVTNADPKELLSLKASTTSQFVRSTGVQIAINGDGFSPWHANGPFDYFPHAGDRVAPDGYAMSEGIAYGHHSGPTIYFARNGEASFTLGDITPYNAISGNNMIVQGGKPIEGLDSKYAAPRTAIGVSGSGKELILFVADGRQPFYSQGATLMKWLNC
jgi:Phosphodiester glycosidase